MVFSIYVAAVVYVVRIMLKLTNIWITLNLPIFFCKWGVTELTSKLKSLAYENDRVTILAVKRFKKNKRLKWTKVDIANSSLVPSYTIEGI